MAEGALALALAGAIVAELIMTDRPWRLLTLRGISRVCGSASRALRSISLAAGSAYVDLAYPVIDGTDDSLIG